MSVANGCCAGMGRHGVAARAGSAVVGADGFVGDADVADVGVNGIPWPLVDNSGRVLAVPENSTVSDECDNWELGEKQCTNAGEVCGRENEEGKEENKKKTKCMNDGKRLEGERRREMRSEEEEKESRQQKAQTKRKSIDREFVTGNALYPE